MQSGGLQALVGNQLTHRDSRLAVPFWVSKVFPGIADHQDVDRLQIGGEIELPAQNVRLEVAHPYAAQAQLRGLEHHVIGQDGGINVPGLLLVKRPHPRPVVVSADDNGQGRTVDIGSFANLRKALGTLDGNQVNRLKIGGGGGHMSSLQDFLQLFRLHFLISVAADGAAFLCNRNKVHDVLSFLN